MITVIFREQSHQEALLIQQKKKYEEEITKLRYVSPLDGSVVTTALVSMYVCIDIVVIIVADIVCVCAICVCMCV